MTRLPSRKFRNLREGGGLREELTSMEKQHHPLVRTIYLYLFALVGLALLSIGTVRMVDLGLKAFVFTAADQSQRIYARQLPAPPFPPEKLDQVQGSADLTAEEKALLRQCNKKQGKNYKCLNIPVNNCVKVSAKLCDTACYPCNSAIHQV